MRNTTNQFINEITNIINGAMAQMNDEKPEKRHQLFSTPEGWVTRIDLPGYEKSDLTLEFEQEALTLTAHNEARGENNLRIALGDEVKVDAISAKLEHGVLEISLPKKEEAIPENHQIEIN